MSHVQTPARALVAIPLALFLAGAALVATSLIGWSVAVEASAWERVAHDKGLLLTSAIGGGAAGALLAWMFTNRTAVLAVGALIGITPALMKATAYFTNVY